jgi:hypothetical protein
MVYCGRGSRASQARWAIMALLLITGIILTIIHSIELRDCKKCSTTRAGVKICENPKAHSADWEGPTTTPVLISFHSLHPVLSLTRGSLTSSSCRYPHFDRRDVVCFQRHLTRVFPSLRFSMRQLGCSHCPPAPAMEEQPAKKFKMSRWTTSVHRIERRYHLLPYLSYRSSIFEVLETARFMRAQLRADLH